jgi:hypothetical protein
MPLPRSVREVVETTLESFYLRRVPPELSGEIRLSHTIRGNTVLLSEARPAWKRTGEWTELSVAQFRYAPASGLWRLYWSDRNDRWHEYRDLAPTPRFLTLLAEVHLDPTGIFWG